MGATVIVPLVAELAPIVIEDLPKVWNLIKTAINHGNATKPTAKLTPPQVVAVTTAVNQTAQDGLKLAQANGAISQTTVDTLSPMLALLVQALYHAPTPVAPTLVTPTAMTGDIGQIVITTLNAILNNYLTQKATPTT